MTISTVPYELQDGYVNHFLVAGPRARRQNLAETTGDVTLLEPKNNSKKSGITKMPVERGPLTEGLFQIGDYQGSWSYLRCEADHYVDLSATFQTPHALTGWAYTQLTSPTAQPVTFTLESRGPADLWLNKKHICRLSQTADSPMPGSFSVNLAEGQNQVMVRFEAIAAPVGLLVFSLRVTGGEGVGVQIPTLIPALDRRKELEEVYQKVYLDRDIYTVEDEIYICWPPGGEKSTYNDVNFKSPSGMIQAQAEDVGKPGDTLFLGHAQTLGEGTCRAQVMPRAWEFYDSQIRITKELSAELVVRSQFQARPYGTLEGRRREALSYAAQTEKSLYAEIARMALGDGQTVETGVITQAVEQLNQRQAGSHLTALALAGLLARFGSRSEFPKWVKKAVRDSLIQFPFELDEPGSAALGGKPESAEIIHFTGAILAGQLAPDQRFPHAGLSGRQVCQKGERLALAWMQSHGALGFSQWDSPSIFSETFTALAHLVDLAHQEAVWGLASVLLDKLLFSMVLNSFQGTFGSSRGYARSDELKSGLLEATSGISRVLWGIGIFNEQLGGMVSAALLQKYELPANIAEIAAFWPEELWSQEQQAAGQVPVNKVMFRTPEYMLCSAQDYRAGEQGRAEHIWQATLGPTCVVFGNHPTRMSEKEEHIPNFWRGNGTLPRVAQWKDVLIALYRLPEHDRLGFTHIYFPVKSFDETILRDGWAFGRKGDGYIALTASHPIELVQQGRTAFRELRAYGQETAWVCQMGRQALDGDFEAFQEKVLGMEISFEGLATTIQTLRSDHLSLGWKGPFQRNQMEQPLGGFKHFENPYCLAELPCKGMEIRTLEYVLRLNFEDLA